ncbi:MAG: hypothetical protein A3J83_08720 [Elusimicrobia bacterium RIFOXYA2_FULL_40_6]|nr:MAG: hypothetical protein A3J83_08720 [Elusimicrobia bacterium RIFOXYA2_FULL_40_6]
MHESIKIIILGLVSAIIFGKTVFGDELGGRLGVGFGYPSLSLKYGLSSRLLVEGKGSSGEGIQVYGGRVYYNFNPKDKIVLYAGGELDSISFNSEDEKGSGTMILGFLGAECFISERLALSADIGPGQINIADSVQSNISVSAPEWILNLGVNVYFGGKGK